MASGHGLCLCCAQRLGLSHYIYIHIHICAAVWQWNAPTSPLGRINLRAAKPTATTRMMTPTMWTLQCLPHKCGLTYYSHLSVIYLFRCVCVRFLIFIIIPVCIPQSLDPWKKTQPEHVYRCLRNQTHPSASDFLPPPQTTAATSAFMRCTNCRTVRMKYNRLNARVVVECCVLARIFYENVRKFRHSSSHRRQNTVSTNVWRIFTGLHHPPDTAQTTGAVCCSSGHAHRTQR